MRLRAYMAEHGLTDAEMAARLNCSVGAVPRRGHLIAIAQATGGAVAAADFFACPAERAPCEAAAIP